MEAPLIQFRKAIGSEAKPLVGLYSESGCGKTKSALLLASGFVGGDMSQVGMIETESGRGEAYAAEPDVGGYQVLPLREEFSPRTYGAAIKAAEDARLRALIIDSASHEWEGIGGVLAMAAKNQEDGKKGPIVWQKPKLDHSREFVARLLQTPIPLVIVCMRAKYPMTETIVNGRKDWTRSTELSPKQSEDILFEMFVHAWIDKEHRAHITKYTVDAMRKVFIDGEPISKGTGERLAAWASGSAKKPSAAAQEQAVEPSGDGAAPEYITPQQEADLHTLCIDNDIPTGRLKTAAGVTTLDQILAADYARALAWVNTAIARRKEAAA